MIKIMDGNTKQISDIPYGMCVWAAGIAPRPLTKKMISNIPGQRNRYMRLHRYHMVLGYDVLSTDSL